MVHVSSKLHFMGALHRGDMHLAAPAAYSSLAAYAQSKLAQVLFAGELQRRGGGAVLSLAVHPGEVMTDVVRSLPGALQRCYRLLLQTILLTPQQGAQKRGWGGMGLGGAGRDGWVLTAVHHRQAVQAARRGPTHSPHCCIASHTVHAALCLAWRSLPAITLFSCCLPGCRCCCCRSALQCLLRHQPRLGPGRQLPRPAEAAAAERRVHGLKLHTHPRQQARMHAHPARQPLANPASRILWLHTLICAPAAYCYHLQGGPGPRTGCLAVAVERRRGGAAAR